MFTSIMCIQKMSRSLLEELKSKHGENEVNEIIAESYGQFYRFQAHLNLHNIKVKREAATADKVIFQKKENSLSNRDEIVQFWEKETNRIYI